VTAAQWTSRLQATVIAWCPVLGRVRVLALIKIISNCANCLINHRPRVNERMVAERINERRSMARQPLQRMPVSLRVNSEIRRRIT
jgi:hypothetical protein